MESSGSSNWRPPPSGDQSMSVSVDTNNEWRSQLPADARQRIVSKIMDTLKKHLPISAPDGIGELNKIAVRFEEKIYNAATNQSDYLRKISMKMLTMEQKNLGMTTSNSGPTSLSITSENQPDSDGDVVGANMVQMRSQAPSMLMTAHTVVGQNPSMQNMPAISQNSLNNPVGQGAASSLYVNPQRQMHVRQLQQSIASQQQHQSQNQLVYQQQVLKQKVSHPLIQSQQESQSLLQASLQSQQPTMAMPSGLQSNSTSLQNQQSSLLSTVTQNIQQNPVQQGTPSIYQQSQPRQPQMSQSYSLQQPPSSVLQQSSQLSQQSTMLSAPQQLLGHQSTVPNIAQQHFGQQNSISDLQQQHSRLPTQQSGLLAMQQSQLTPSQQTVSMHQQQLSAHNNLSGLQQQLSQQQQQQSSQQTQQHPQLPGSLSNMANLPQHSQPAHMLQHTKTPGQLSQASGTLLQLQGQQTSQQQHVSQLQTQSIQLQQQMSMQQVNSLQREVHHRHQAPGAILQPQSVVDQQKQLQTQRVLAEATSTSIDTSQTTQVGTDADEDIYEKIKSMKDIYLPELHEMHQKITAKLQQHEGLVLPPKQSEHLEYFKKYKIAVDRMIQMLQMPKRIPGLKDKLPSYEKQIIGLISLNRKRLAPQPTGQQFQHPVGINQSVSQLSSQSTQLQQPDALMNQVQSMNMQTSASSMQANGVSNMQGGSISSATLVAGAHSTSQNMANSLQPCSNVDSSQGNALSSLQQGAAGSLQQSNLGTLNQASVGVHQQNSMNVLLHNGASPMQSNVSPLQQNSNALQHPQIKQEQQQHQLMHAQQMKQQIQQRQLQHLQHHHKHQNQMLQQQSQVPNQLLQQKQLQQHGSQVQPHQIQQHHQMNELNARHSGAKPGIFQSHNQVGQRQAYYQQQLKSSSPFSPQAPSPLMSQHSSPQVDQQVIPSHHKGGTPVQSATPPIVINSPSTPLAPSPLPGDNDKQSSSFPSLSNAGIGQSHLVPGQAQVQSLAVSTPGISVSPLLAELDGFQPNMSALIPGKLSSAEQPIERLIKAVKSSSSTVLRSSISDMSAVVSMIDRIAGAAPGNGSRAAVGEDLVAMTKCRMQAKNFMSQDGSANTRKMKRQISAMPCNDVPCAGGADENTKQSLINISQLESIATTDLKRPKLEETSALLNEIRDINQRLIDTVVDVTDHDIDATAESGEGTVVKFTFCAVALSPNLKSELVMADASPILPLHVLVPKKYPSCSPIVLDNIPMELRGSNDLSSKARARFGISLRDLPQAMSLEDMASTWDTSAREVILEYALQNGGGSFSSRYGTWENCVSA